jgi:signal transduction histidine kinase
VRIGRSRDAGTPFVLEHRVIRTDGAMRTIQGRGRAIANSDGRPIRLIGTVEDITERKELLARLVFSDRMVSVGTLAAGVAHEINNPLAYISANLDELAAFAGTRPEVISLLHEASDGIERIRKVVRGLQAFSRADDDQRAPLDVEAVLELALGITSGELRHRARVVRELGGTPPVAADEARLGQVFINLLVNASEAIPEGQADQNEIRVVTRTDTAGWARIAIHDTGGGIPTAVQGRIFDPFFTTKPIGAGIGLGLSICAGIVRSLGGEITFQTESGRGSVFHVALPPARSATLPRSRPTSEPGLAPNERRGRVLIVDDELILANSLRRLLSRDHAVSIVSSGKAAFDRLRAGERFDVILCDLMMPELTGMDLHAQLAQLSPEQAERMIFMTGGAFSISARQFLERVTNPCFDKPCDLAALRAAIRERVGS